MSELTFPNLVLTFQHGTGQFTTDENGNPIEKTEDVIVHASVKKSSNPQFYRLPGISTTDLQLVGKVVSKSVWGNSWVAGSLPSSVNLESEAQAVLTAFDGTTQAGTFRFMPVTQSRLSSIISTFGERISGYLRLLGRN